MAIVIEEERRGPSIIPILIWTIVVGVVIVAAYYLFFNQPQLIPLPTPPSLQNTDALANIQFDPQDVLGNPTFQALRQFVVVPDSSAANAGRANPFLPF